MSDIGWVDIFTGDATEVGGSIKADVNFEGTPDVPNSPWRTNGTISGTGLRFIRIDDGVRLVDGTLAARLQDDSLILQSLRFPTAERVTPGDSRIRDYLKTADAQGGYLSASGNWSLSKSTGTISIDVHRYPAVQRSDRYIMLSGKIDLNAALPRLSISGNLTADCGWVSLEVLSQVPTLDDDVKIIRVGTRPGDGGGDSSGDDSGSSGPLAINMDLKVDLGSRFYITGMGLDAGLAGALDIRDADGRLTGVGAVRTRSGRIDAYGQRLQITQGVITFQGALDNPLLDIEALRVNQQVQAGVKVTGTARRPRIDLVSIPDVSEVEKLSWLILGRAPNQGGNDAALLISAGTSLLGGGEPFYKRFGLDDVSMRSGTIGSSGSLLPDQTVASQVTQSSTDSTLATQFLVASKNFSNGVTLSVEQAMAGSQTVGRLSYRLARHWSVDLKGGGVTGLALVYRTFFED
jgi:translocation and assembly module TamB